MRAAIALLVFAGLAAAEVTIPDGTRLRVRLDQTISSGTADEGQAVELSVTEPVKIGDQVVIPEGARVTGTITMAQEKRHMGRAGKLDFSIDRVRAIDGDWIPLRYTVNKKSGGSHAVSTGVLTAGAAVLFWPAAPAFLLIKGKDVTINKGVVFDTFTDRDHVLPRMRREQRSRWTERSWVAHRQRFRSRQGRTRSRFGTVALCGSVTCRSAPAATSL